MSTSKTIEQALATIGSQVISVTPGMLLRDKADPNKLRLVIGVGVNRSVVICLDNTMRFNVELGDDKPWSYWRFETCQWEVVDVLEHVYVR